VTARRHELLRCRIGAAVTLRHGERAGPVDRVAAALQPLGIILTLGSNRREAIVLHHAMTPMRAERPDFRSRGVGASHRRAFEDSAAGEVIERAVASAAAPRGPSRAWQIALAL
jgi:hypothetical protein